MTRSKFVNVLLIYIQNEANKDYTPFREGKWFVERETGSIKLYYVKAIHINHKKAWTGKNRSILDIIEQHWNDFPFIESMLGTTNVKYMGRQRRGGTKSIIDT